jgi:hypothetical protein
LSELAALNFASKAREGVDANAHEQGVTDCVLTTATRNEGPETSSEGRERTLGKQRTDARRRRSTGRCTRGRREQEPTKTAEERSKELDHVITTVTVPRTEVPDTPATCGAFSCVILTKPSCWNKAPVCRP